MLNISKQLENDTLLIALEGKLDTATSPILEKELSESMDGVGTLVFDFDKLVYISSSGLRILLYAQKIMMAKDGKMSLKNVNELIMDIFEVTGFAEILTIE